jgi:biotin/methionine sulfoxide reductase
VTTVSSAHFGALHSRVARPAVRRGWLDRGPGPAPERGADTFVEVDRDTALDLVAAELSRVLRDHGDNAVFGGSHGWASAGRFHHAQSQLHRFLSLGGGYTASVNSYSLGDDDCPGTPDDCPGTPVWLAPPVSR